MKINLIRFDMKVGRNKPENIIHRENDCPFCHPEGLTDIYATDEGGIILLKNKYDVLENAVYVLRKSQGSPNFLLTSVWPPMAR